MPVIQGKFDVQLLPQPADELTSDAVGRLLLDKRYHGELDATAVGQMLAIRSPVPGSAGYVAMERVSGMLAGRRGSFALQHRGVMTRGAPELLVTVVPDSGTGELEGLAGTLRIDIADGVHSYVFDYSLPG
jgi:hypothetical protein